MIVVAAPFTRWDGGYRYLYMRALYPLTGRVVLPLIDERDRPRPESLEKANVIAAYRCQPPLAHFAVVWRGPDGVLMRRIP